MHRTIRLATYDDIPAIMPVIDAARELIYEKIYKGAWLNDEPYYVIHRLASWPDVHGVWDSVLEWAFERIRTLRVDTHRDNTIMQHNILKHGFTYCGIIYLLSGDERLAYQKTINRI